MTDQTGTVVKKRRALIAVGVLLLALCAGGACLALKGGKTGGATLGLSLIHISEPTRRS